MCYLYLARDDPSVKDRVTNIAVTNLCSIYHRNVKRITAVRTNKTKINRLGGLQLHFKKLMPNIGKSPVILIPCIAQRITYQSVQPCPTITLLHNANICEGFAYERRKPIKQTADCKQFGRLWMHNRRCNVQNIDVRLDKWHQCVCVCRRDQFRCSASRNTLCLIFLRQSASCIKQSKRLPVTTLTRITMSSAFVRIRTYRRVADNSSFHT